MIDTLSSSGENLPDDLWLAAYLYGIEVTYPDFAVVHRSSAQIKIPKLSTVMVKLEDKGRQARVVKSTALSARSKDNTKKGNNYELSRGGYKDSRSTSCPKKTKEKCDHYDAISYSEDFCWKRYLERAPLWWKKDGTNNSKPDAKNRKKNGVIFNLAAIAGIYNHEIACHTFPACVNEIRVR